MVQPRARTTRRSIQWTDLIILSAATVAIWFTEMCIIQVLTNTDTTSLFNCATSPVEKALSLQVSVSYKTLSSYSPITSLPTKQAWERDMGISIDETDWQEVWTRAMDISTCSRIKSIQFKIVRGRHITPVLKNKMDANASPLCWKCKTGIVNELSAIFSVSILMDPMCLILGLPDAHITNTKHGRLFNILTFAAKKNIFSPFAYSLCLFFLL